MVDMTRAAIQQITKEMRQYQSPALNDKLYLHFKGWKKIDECLGDYSGVRALWLEGNGLRSLENLGNLKELRCLYVQQNCLESLEGLEHNDLLDAVNASNNSIKRISHVKHLPRLNTLHLAHNRLADLADVEELAECKTVGVLDISNNKLEDPAIVDILAKMDNLHVLQMQGNPVNRKIQHYRKTIVARCRKLTYLDDRPVFEDERRTVTAWARGGAGHKAEPNMDGTEGELTAVALCEALADGTFDKNKAHEAEKEERKLIREEKEEKERRNREAFREMMLDSRVKRIMQILPNSRLLKDVSEQAIEELAHRICQNPVHTNEVVGLARDETAIHAGAQLGGLYIITRGRLQMQKNGKPVSSTGGKLASGQYFGEVALCTAHAQIASADMVCTEYSELYCLTTDALMEVAELYEGTLDVLQANRAQALRCQWHECKPWQAYDLLPSCSIKVNRSKAPPSDDDRLMAAMRSGAEDYDRQWNADASEASEGVRVGGPVRNTAGQMMTEDDEWMQNLADAQTSKRAFRRQPREPVHNPPPSAFMARASVVSWFAVRDNKVPELPKTGTTTEYVAQAPAQYPLEWYGKNELARSAQVSGDDVWDSEAFGGYHHADHYGSETGMRIKGCDDEYNKQFARVQAARSKAFQEEADRRGCSVEIVAAEADRLAEERRERARDAADGEEDTRTAPGTDLDDDLPPLEDVDVTQLQFGDGRAAPLPPPPLASRASAVEEGEEDVPPALEDVDVASESMAGAAPSRGFYAESDEAVLAATGQRQFKTQYEKDNHATQGEYNRELEATGQYNQSFSSKTQQRCEPTNSTTTPNSGDFEAATAYAGSRKGCVFKMGAAGLGYYLDSVYGGAVEDSMSNSSEALSATAAVASSEVQVVADGADGIEEMMEEVSTKAPMFGDGGIDDLD